MEPAFPVEFVVQGTPVSLQGSSDSKRQWKERVKKACTHLLPEGHWATQDEISATLFYFPSDKMQGDVDNIVKMTLDALSKYIYVDDSQVTRVLVQKFEPGKVFSFKAPSAVLLEALNGDKPLLYIRLSKDPFEELK